MSLSSKSSKSSKPTITRLPSAQYASVPSPLWKKILGLARPEWRTLAYATFFLIIASVTGLYFPKFVKDIIDQVTTHQGNATLQTLFLGMLGILFLQSLASAIRYYLFTIAGERIVLKLRYDLYAHLLNQDIAFFDASRTGDLMSRLSQDTTLLQNAVSVNISMFLRHFFTAIGGLVLMIHTCASLALSMLLVIPPIALGAAKFGKIIRATSKKSQENIGEASNVAEETLSGIRTVRSYVQEDFEKLRYQKSLNLALQSIKAKITSIAYFVLLASLIASFSISWVIYRGGVLVTLNQLSVGDLTQFLIYLLMVAFSVGALGGLWGDFMAALGAAERLFELFANQPLIQLSGGETIAHPQGYLSLKNISFAYPMRKDLPVLQNFSIDIAKGRIVALVGMSGSGKSTLAHLIARLYDPQSGELFFDHIPYQKLNPLWLRQQIGVVAQEPILISSTIGENIRYGLNSENVSEAEIIQAAMQANAWEFIQKFPEKLNTIVGERGIQLSGGQKQRVAIARAILKNPKILILDEATSALDTESEALVQQALSHLMQGRTTIVIAHRLATIQNVDRIFVLESGIIKQAGTHQELLQESEGIYYKLVHKQLS